jgi:regulator of sigma E protease
MFGWTDKKGTRWRFSWIPLGGYVMMLGDADASSVKSDLKNVAKEDIDKTLTSKTPLQRTMVALGGPLMNIIFTLLVFTIICIWKGIPDVASPTISFVVAESTAEKYGLQKDDLITGINNEKIDFLSEIKKSFKKNAGKDIVLHYKRGSEERKSVLPLYSVNESGKKIPLEMIGVSLSGRFIFIKASAWSSLSYGVSYCYESAIGIVSGIARAFIGQKDGAKLGGLLSIGDIAKKSMYSGFVVFLRFMAALSFSLAIINLLPIPVLDGGTIAISLLEFIRGKPLSPATINVIYTFGLIAVVCLMLLATWNDLVNFGIVKKIITFFK